MSKIKVLVVDDSRMSYLKINDALSGTNFTICGFAKNGFEAIEQYKLLEPDLVTMDMYLPDMNGIECSKQILQSAPDARIVMISSMRDDKLKVKGREAGINFFLQKPFNKQELIITLEMLFSMENTNSDSIESIYVKPFIRVFKESLQLLGEIDSDVELNKIPDQYLEIDGIASVISLIGSPVKKITLYTDFETSRAFAAKMLKLDSESLSENDIVDSIEELTNIVVGRTSSYINDLVKEQEIRIVPLGTMYGKNMKIVNSKLDSYNLKAVSDLGTFNLDIAVVGGD